MPPIKLNESPRPSKSQFIMVDFSLKGVEDNLHENYCGCFFNGKFWNNGCGWCDSYRFFGWICFSGEGQFWLEGGGLFLLFRGGRGGDGVVRLRVAARLKVKDGSWLSRFEFTELARPPKSHFIMVDFSLKGIQDNLNENYFVWGCFFMVTLEKWVWMMRVMPFFSLAFFASPTSLISMI